MKKLTALMLAAAMSMTALTACGSKTEESAAAPASTEAAKEEGGKAAEGGEAKETSGLKVAAIFGGAINDGNWNETQYNGLKSIEEAGAEIAIWKTSAIQMLLRQPVHTLPRALIWFI